MALVTGGGTGLGRQFAITLAAAGAAVIVVGRRKAPLQETVKRIEIDGGQAACVAADISVTADIQDIVSRCSEYFGAPDILVNAAGVNLRQPVDDIAESDWDMTLNINLKTPFFLARTVSDAMKAKGAGKIINIASLQSQRAFANSLPYGASKGGICQLTRAMAETWSSSGIQCNAIAPGFFRTELTQAVFDDTERASKLAAQTAIGRNGEPEDLNGPLLFFASSASDYVTGQTLYVDGGFTAK
ncbi:SDR family NAD(P)-dependent oxidoreductase [Veronia nyctiphanis]|uniref:SDR family NAD(P)-dependent oxidoreductase n=1 Tax=Veronia nyctiphanis TaxID=1278244 RepID=UPI001F2A65AD|nr:SDR family oxidoreductase [Veronia nyctiphanis]